MNLPDIAREFFVMGSDPSDSLENLDQMLRWIFPERRDRSEEKKNAFDRDHRTPGMAS